MPPIVNRLMSVVASLILSVPAFAQTVPALEVQRLAPQLIGFAGTEANFQSLVNGLALGTPVTLVSVTPDGLLQTATFTPSVRLSALEIARTLEQARQNLISRGIGLPNGEQIGVSLLGGSLATPVGSVPVAGLLTGSASASAGSSGPAAPGTDGLTVSTQRIPQAAGTVPQASTQSPAATLSSQRLRNTSDSPFTSNTSDTPAPGVAGPNGPPSPAQQLQNRR